jgi:hypothetical protein
MRKHFLILVVACLAAPSLTVSDEPFHFFAKLSVLEILIEGMSRDETSLGISRDDIEQRITIDLRRDLPRVKIAKHAAAGIYVRVTCLDIHVAVCSYEVQMNRWGTVLSDFGGEPIDTGTVTVWEEGGLISGSDMRSRISSKIDAVMTKFVAECYAENP